MEDLSRKVNFRVTDAEWEVLRAVANLSEQSVPRAAYEIVRRALSQEAKDPHVQADIANRAGARAARAGEVVPLRGRATKKRPADRRAERGRERPVHSTRSSLAGQRAEWVVLDRTLRRRLMGAPST